MLSGINITSKFIETNRYTGEVASKLTIVLSIVGPFWLIYVGLYGKRAYVK